jgi:hypothetical protein
MTDTVKDRVDSRGREDNVATKNLCAAGLCLEVIVVDAIDVSTKLPVTPARRSIEIIRTKRTFR